MPDKNRRTPYDYTVEYLTRILPESIVRDYEKNQVRAELAYPNYIKAGVYKYKYIDPKKEREAAFQEWYAKHAAKLGLNPNPDDPRHFYDYRAAFQAGAKPSKTGHWPSKFKREGHPNLIVDGINTKTGQRVNPLRGNSK